MTVSVLVPWRPGCPHRERAWAWVRHRYESSYPDWEIVTSSGPAGPFSRSAAILDAASRARGDVLVVADADVWCDPAAAVDAASSSPWAIPHRLIHRLSADSTERLIGGADWRGLPLSTDNAQDRKPYRGHQAATLLVLRRDVLEEAPPDPRFVGWGQEDDAWAGALNTLVGAPWRGYADLVHLWHPPQARHSRTVGNQAGVVLWRRYRNARTPELMRHLIEEGRRCSSSTASTTEASPSS